MSENIEAALLPSSYPHHQYGATGAHTVSALWKTGYKTAEDLESCGESVRHFYEAQNTLLERFRDAAHASRVEEDDILSVNRAIIATNIANVVLLVCQVYAFISSGALAVLAVFIDAFLDLVSGFVVATTYWMRKRRDKHRYPVGRSRLEPLGVIGMACLMTAATLLTLEESIKSLLRGKSDSFVGLTVTSGAVLLFALLTKASLYAYCHKIDHMSVQALAEDHFNDCLANSMSFVAVIIAQNVVWWLDPVCGIVISCLIIRNWIRHTLERFDQLLGRVADKNVLNVLTFVASHHSEHIHLVDTVRAYHVGNGIYAEVDVVLSAEMPLREAHDVGESLQVRIEALDEIERCFVHLDFETEHSPSTEHKEI